MYKLDALSLSCIHIKSPTTHSISLHLTTIITLTVKFYHFQEEPSSALISSVYLFQSVEKQDSDQGDEVICSHLRECSSCNSSSRVLVFWYITSLSKRHCDVVGWQHKTYYCLLSPCTFIWCVTRQEIYLCRKALYPAPSPMIALRQTTKSNSLETYPSVCVCVQSTVSFNKRLYPGVIWYIRSER